MNDYWEHNNGLNPLINDAGGDPDEDNLNNFLEYIYMCDPQDSDSDSDGYEDGLEILHGTDPNDATDYPTTTDLPTTESSYYWIGGLSRLTIGKEDLISKPRVLIIDTETQEIKEILLKSVKPAEEVFDLTKLQERQESEKRFEDFIVSLNEIEFKSMDLKTRIVEICKKEKIDDDVKQEILRRI